MGKSSKAPEQKVTAEEIAMIEQAEEQWSFWEKNGRPVQNEFVQQTTGFNIGSLPDYERDIKNPDGTVTQGQTADITQYKDQDSKVWESDGSLRTDASAAIAGTEKAYGQGMNRINPNSGAYRGSLNDLAVKKMNTGHEAEAGQRIGQQNQWLGGLENAIAMGRGQQTQAIQGQAELAGRASQKAAQDAQNAFADQSANRHLVGQVAGAATTYGLRKGHGKQFGLGSL